jgi:hypothetical protein
MELDALFIPECVVVQETITAPKEISAIELIRSDSGARLGHIAAVPGGSQLEICGSGFNQRTVKVRWNDRFFFVFLQDLGWPPDADSPEAY